MSGRSAYVQFALAMRRLDMSENEAQFKASDDGIR